jgi:hypothetical protein
MVKDWWKELWNPDNRIWQFVDRALFVFLPLVALFLFFTPNIPQGWKDIMSNLMWLIPLSIWVLFSLTVIPLKLASRYKRDYIKVCAERDGAIKKPKPELSMKYQVLCVYPDNSFDCRVIIANTGTESSKFTKVVITVDNLDILSISNGNYKRIDHLRNKVPTIQWNYAGSVIHLNELLQILDLKLKIKIVDKVSLILSEIYADSIDNIMNVHILNIGELEIMKSKIDKREKAFLDSSNDLARLALKAMNLNRHI